MTLPAEVRRVAHEEIGSTNSEALKLAEAGAPEFTLVTARRQTAGRGRRGRAWTSPNGNLFASVVLRPQRPLATVSQLSFVAALAVGELLDGLGVRGRVGLKWPNDVLIDGAKVSGILLEAGEGHVVAGIGVNLAHYPVGTAYPTTSVAVAGGQIDVERALGHLAASLIGWYRRWLDDGFEPVRAAWLARAHGLGHEVRITRHDGGTDSGVFSAVDESGALVLTGAGGSRKITAGDVFFAA
jgi:BirA family transcriptional regulator, biotin operon repressor / biotin---[acetyl-CoA-carboxylase] ligase